jgi:hypothetical protein
LPTLPAPVLEKAPIAGVDPLRLTFLQLDRPQARIDEPIRFWPSSSPAPPQTPLNLSDVRTTSPVTSDLSGTLGPGRAALMQFQHPEAVDRTVIVLTAGVSEDLLAGSRALWNPMVQSGCRGDLLLVNLEKPDHETLAHLVGPSYYLGSPGRIPVVHNFINSHPLLALAGLLILLLVLCALILKVLKRRRRQRLDPSQS